MLFISAEDFFEKVSRLQPLKREEEIALARQMGAGDPAARERLIAGYLPFTAAHIRRLSREMQTLRCILLCCQALEKAVDSFNFLQESEPFSHRLSWCLRQAVTKYIADRH